MERKEIRGYDAVRNAAKDFDTYSSDLLGDRDVRSYRQLPLEADPPRHTSFRSAVQPLFLSAAIEPKGPQFEALAKKLISELNARGSGDIASEISLPFVIGCLTIIYGRPQDYEEWLSWGPDVWTADSHSSGASEHIRDGKTLQAYLDRVFDAAQANLVTDPDKQDVWDVVSQLKVDGGPITRYEMQGIANVLLAGGRDTVIKLLTGLTWHLVGNDDDREFLKSNQDWFNRTIAEMVRFLSPLPKMERVLEADKTASDADRDASKYVLLSFVSANHDKSIWSDADRFDMHRERKPHLAFGFGRHSCMGMNITEHEAGAFLRVLLNDWPNWIFDGEPEIEWASAQAADGSEIKFIDRFKSLKVTTS